MKTIGIWLTSLLLAQNLAAYIYDESLLLIYAKIVPRIIALDRTPHRIVSGRPTLCILYEKGDEKVAAALASSIRRYTPSSREGGKPFEVTTLSYDRVEECRGAISFLLMPTRDAKLRKALKKAHREKILTFAYDKAMLGRGAVVSIHPGKRVYPLINIDVLKRDRLRLDPTLLQVAKIYRGDSK